MAVRYKMEQNHGLQQGHFNLHFLGEELLLVPVLKSTNSLWKYNFAENQWSEWHRFDKVTNKIGYHTSVLNENQTKLYIFGDPGNLAVIDLKTGEITESVNQFHDGSHSRSLWIDNQFHIFGGWEQSGKAHFVYNEEKMELNQVHKFDANDFGISDVSLAHHTLCHMESANSILILHNIDSRAFMYSLNSHKCKSLAYMNVLMDGYFFPKAFMLENDRILLYSPRWIGILDLSLEKMMESKLKIPESTNYPLLKDDEYKREMVVFGYIHQQKELRDIVPIDIIKSIQVFCCFDYLYFIGDGEYFVLSVDEIIKHIHHE